MKFKLIEVGKTIAPYLLEGIKEYEKRISHYASFEKITIDALKKAKNISKEQQKKEEGKKILANIPANMFVVLLDEKGKMYTSLNFATFLQKRMHAGQDVCFIIGGAYGFSEEVYKRANNKMALSEMTFSHQMIRIFFLEQLYRGFTILKGEKYHHE